MKPEKIPAAEMEIRLAKVPNWKIVNGELSRAIDCRDYGAALALLVQIGFAAEKLDHHPDIVWKYKKLTLSVTTHDAGGLTELDFQLAGEIDRLAARL